VHLRKQRRDLNRIHHLFEECRSLTRE
jgi:hypothetical protein